MSHRMLSTAVSTVVQHSHPDQVYEFSAADKVAYQAQTLAAYPGTQPVHYTHLTHLSEELGPTKRYNCWGFTFNPRQCWIDSGSDVQNILDGNGTQVSAPGLRVGDVICYRDDGNEITHTGRIWSLTGAGQAALIQSKWGGLGEYLHPPLTVPEIYGKNVSFWRVSPLSGKGDAWHKDNSVDDRLPATPGVCWLSPDIWCNNSGGTSHQDPIRGQPNQLYAKLTNADSLPINGQVRLYWADPNGGIPHTDWNSIGAATAVAAPGTTIVVGPVSWTPSMTIPSHVCLLAIADTGDDPFTAATTDPIVWPFDIWRDNNVVQRNLAVITVKSGKTEPLPFIARNPLPFVASISVVPRLSQLTRADIEELGVDEKALVAPSKLPLDTRRTTTPRIQLNPAGRGARWRIVDTIVGTHAGQATLHLANAKPGAGGRLLMNATVDKDGPSLEAYRLDIEQRVGGGVTGGMTYVLVVRRR